MLDGMGGNYGADARRLFGEAGCAEIPGPYVVAGGEQFSQKPSIVDRGVIGEVKNSHSRTSAKLDHWRHSPAGKSFVSFLPTTRSRSYGNTATRGAGRRASNVSARRIVPAGRAFTARRHRRWTTTVSRSFSATNLLEEPRASSSSRVRSTISRHDEGVMEKGWSGPSR